MATNVLQTALPSRNQMTPRPGAYITEVVRAHKTTTVLWPSKCQKHGGGVDCNSKDVRADKTGTPDALRSMQCERSVQDYPEKSNNPDENLASPWRASLPGSVARSEKSNGARVARTARSRKKKSTDPVTCWAIFEGPTFGCIKWVETRINTRCIAGKITGSERDLL